LCRCLFHATASTSIYIPSLHDALPICFSFYATKNVVTGEGGMIIGRDENMIARAKVLALHGMSKDAWHRFSDKGYKHYQVVEAGDRKSTRLNSSHVKISYAVFCSKKKR